MIGKIQLLAASCVDLVHSGHHFNGGRAARPSAFVFLLHSVLSRRRIYPSRIMDFRLRRDVYIEMTCANLCDHTGS